MADLIININLDESRKKQGLIIETFEGTIPHLKSKQISGQIQNSSLSSISSVDNLSLADLQNVKDVFNEKINTQISKFQYFFSVKSLPYLIPFVSQGIVFCKDKRQSAMYEIEHLLLNSEIDGLESIHNFSVFQDKTTLYINYDITEDSVEAENEIIPLFYIDITSEKYSSELFFDYGKDVVKATEKEIFLNNDAKYRNYKFEKETISIIKKAHWQGSGKEDYIYVGKDIYEDISKLERSGIRLYTNEKKKISVASFDNISVNYGVDWFELNGTATAGDIKIKLSDLIDFRKRKEDWVEYNGQIVFAPTDLKKLEKDSIKRKGDHVKVSKEDILTALEIVNLIKKDNMPSYNDLSRFQDIELKISDKLDQTLRDYQRIGVKWLLSLRRNGFGGCLADDMGLGKTLQVITYLSDKSLNGTDALIVVPKTLIDNWNREIKKYASEISTYIYHGPRRNFDDALKYRAVITTYGTLLNDIAKISKHKFDHLIVDEAQTIKNSKSKVYRAVRLVNATTKIVMTGTPLENNIQEYWGLMKLVNPTNLSYKRLVKGLSEEQAIEKVKRLTNPFLLRRYKKDVLKDLPPKEDQIIYCSFDESQRKLYNKMLQSIRHEIDREPDRFEIKTNSIVLRGLIYLQEICCHPKLIPKQYNEYHCSESAKLDQLLLMVDELYATGHKIVVFSRFTRMLEIINKELRKKHFNVFYLDGSTDNRQKVVDDFEANNDGIFLISLKAGGVGLNLVSADTAIIYDPWWNPAVEKQAEDRIYRIGQKNKVTVYKLIAVNTIEEKVQILQEIKERIFNEIVKGHDVPHSLTMEDIRTLLN